MICICYIIIENYGLLTIEWFPKLKPLIESVFYANISFTTHNVRSNQMVRGMTPFSVVLLSTNQQSKHVCITPDIVQSSNHRKNLELSLHIGRPPGGKQSTPLKFLRIFMRNNIYVSNLSWLNVDNQKNYCSQKRIGLWILCRCKSILALHSLSKIFRDM